jgi:hypothetical protein
MSEVIVYLDEETDGDAPLGSVFGVTYSRWLAGLIRAVTRETWPEDYCGAPNIFARCTAHLSLQCVTSALRYRVV